MAILPYMKQLPQDYYRNNYPAPVVVVAAPPEEEAFTPPEQPPLMGTPLPPPSGGGVPEAPTDGKTYARENTVWTSQWDGGSY